MTQRLTVGIALTTEPERSRRLLEDFCGRLADATALGVVAHGIWPYHHLLEALESGGIDLVWLPPLLALRATASKACTPIALPVREGVSTYSSALFARQDSAIASVEQLHRCRVGWVDAQSAAGYLVIRARLRQLGVDLTTAFSQELYFGSHRAVVQAVKDGAVDVGATFAHFTDADPQAPPTRAGWEGESMRVLCRADSIPSDVVAAGRRVEVSLRLRVQSALVAGNDRELMRTCRSLMGASEFVAPSDDHLGALLALLAELDREPRASRTSVPPR